jgi:hypothetical protein
LDNGVLFSTNNEIQTTWSHIANSIKSVSDTAPAADVELSDDALREVEMIMKDAVPTGRPSPDAM